MRSYVWRGSVYKFHEADVPADAQPVDAVEPSKPVEAKEAPAPANKARRVRSKAKR